MSPVVFNILATLAVALLSPWPVGAGTYDLQVSMIGCRTVTSRDVVVLPGETCPRLSSTPRC